MDQNKDDPRYNSYDGLDPAAGARGMVRDPEAGLRYARCWKRVRKGAIRVPDPAEPRQLCVKSPPNDTVVTWCSMHRRNPLTATLGDEDKDMVAFLDGSVHTVPSRGSGHGARP
jgi:hypothetical protein